MTPYCRLSLITLAQWIQTRYKAKVSCYLGIRTLSFEHNSHHNWDSCSLFANAGMLIKFFFGLVPGLNPAICMSLVHLHWLRYALCIMLHGVGGWITEYRWKQAWRIQLLALTRWPKSASCWLSLSSVTTHLTSSIFPTTCSTSLSSMWSSCSVGLWVSSLPLPRWTTIATNTSDRTPPILLRSNVPLCDVSHEHRVFGIAVAEQGDSSTELGVFSVVAWRQWTPAISSSRQHPTFVSYILQYTVNNEMILFLHSPKLDNHNNHSMNHQYLI